MELRGERVTLRPVVAGDAVRLREIRDTPAVARWWDHPEPQWPLEDDDPATFLTILIGERVVGFIQFGEELEPRYREASIDIFLDPAEHGRGLGTEAIRVLVDHLVADRGHHRVVIDPSVDNAAAIRCYTKAGFSPVGVMRAYELDPHTGTYGDGLLMELVRLPAGGR